MTNAKEIAVYFFQKDKEQEVFTSEIIERGQKKFVVGNARVNKYMHIAQNMWIAKTGELLFSQPLLAFDNGAVVEDVRTIYAVLRHNAEKYAVNLSDKVREFLDKIYVMLRNATIDELIELSHQDNEWNSKKSYYSKKDQEMNSLSRKNEYEKQYADALIILERINL